MANTTLSCGGCHARETRSVKSVYAVTLFGDSPQLVLSWWPDESCCRKAQSGSDWATGKHGSSAASHQLE